MSSTIQAALEAAKGMVARLSSIGTSSANQSMKVGSLMRATNSFLESRLPRVGFGGQTKFRTGVLNKLAPWGVGAMWAGGTFAMKAPRSIYKTLHTPKEARPSTLRSGPGYISWSKCLSEDTLLFYRDPARDNSYSFYSMKLAKSIMDSGIELEVLGVNVEMKTEWIKIKQFHDVDITDGLKITLSHDDFLICTEEHRFLVNRDGKVNLKAASFIEPGDTLIRVIFFNPNSMRENLIPVEINKIERVSNCKFLDLEVDSETHLYALGNGVITHNSNGMPYDHLSASGVGLSLSNLRHSSIL